MATTIVPATKLDALIAGAGPVGLAMASELARYGLNVRIVDKAPVRTDKSKALVIWSRTLELMDSAGASAALLAAGRTCNAANLMSGAKILAHIVFDGVSSPHPYGLMIPQSETERVLDEHLQSFGVHVERSAELVSFHQTDTAVTCTVHKPDVGEETLEASWLIACDGAHSTVRHALNIPFEGETLASDWMLADVQLHGMPNPGEMHIFLHESGPLAIFPIGQPSSQATESQRSRVIASVGAHRSGQARPEPTLADVQNILDQRGTGGVTASDPIWLANFGINERKISNYRSGRVFFAGDAAHIHSPAGGQGMNTGIQDACNLAWKLALVRMRNCPDSLLDSYSAERSPVARQVLKSTGALTSLATMHNPALLAFRNTTVSLVLGFPPAKHAMADQLTELSVSYPESPLNGYADAAQPKPGTRVPIQGGEAPLNAGSSPRFALFAEPNDTEHHELLRAFPDLLEPTLRNPFHADGIWLVRPDGYVSVASTKWPDIRNYLARLVS